MIPPFCLLRVGTAGLNVVTIVRRPLLYTHTQGTREKALFMTVTKYSNVNIAVAATPGFYDFYIYGKHG